MYTKICQFIEHNINKTGLNLKIIGNKKCTLPIINYFSNQQSSIKITNYSITQYLTEPLGDPNKSKYINVLCFNASDELLNTKYKDILQKLFTSKPYTIIFDFNNLHCNYIFSLAKNFICNKLLGYFSIKELLVSSNKLNGIIDNNIKVYLTGPDSDYIKTNNKLKILATISHFNEKDIIIQTIQYLTHQGIYVRIIDNWSTDGSYEKIIKLSQTVPLLSVERFPKNIPPKYYEWKKILQRIETISETTTFDWYIHYDSDEIRESPWDNCNLIQGISFIDSLGYNAIDFTILNFRFTKSTNNFSKSKDPMYYFKYCDFGRNPAHFIQIKAWKNTNNKINISNSGGHDAVFEGRKIYPIKFLTKHYPLRSPKQTNKKLYLERFPRFSPKETKIGWHSHYNQYKTQKKITFDQKDLIFYDKAIFNKKYIIERISGVGIIQEN